MINRHTPAEVNRNSWGGDPESPNTFLPDLTRAKLNPPEAQNTQYYQ